MFRVVAVSKGGVKIGIAGGALARGKTVTLKPGRKLTLVDTATGARYTLQLVYVGSSPEQTASFTSGETTSAGTSPPPAGTTSATTP
jgi:hypothetical protein